MKVLGLGDNVVDRYVNKKIMFPGGNAVNFAVYARECGLESAFLGYIGDDAEADHIIASLKEEGVDITGCHRIFGTTTERCDVNLIDGDRVFIAADMRETKVPPVSLSGRDIERLKDFDLIHAACYGCVEDELPKLSGLRGLKTFDFSVEEKYKEDGYLQKVCPWIDMALFSCEGMTEEEIQSLQEKVHGLGCRYVLATMGTAGQSLYDGSRRYSGRVKLVDAVDTMGAGDSFFSSFVCMLLKQGWTRENPLTEQMIGKAFEKAAEFSANNCLRNGGFGHPAPIAGE